MKIRKILIAILATSLACGLSLLSGCGEKAGGQPLNTEDLDQPQEEADSDDFWENQGNDNDGGYDDDNNDHNSNNGNNNYDDNEDNDNYDEDEEEQCDHYWTDATCDQPVTCVMCGETTGEALGHTWTGGSCTEAQYCSQCGHDGEPVGHSWVEATCTTRKTCSVCAVKEGEKAAHDFVNNTCINCNALDPNSEEGKYALLKKKADGIAFSCAETALRSNLKNPSSMTVLGEEILDSDDYFRYYIKIDYSALNNLGGLVTDTAYFLIRVNPAMNGNFYHTHNTTLGIKYIISESQRVEWGWDTQPDDWSLDAADKYADPVEVSIKMLLADPQRYVGQYVQVTEKLVVSSNYLGEKRFYCYQSTGDEKFDINTDNHLNVFYRMCDNIDECIMLEADYQKITVIGEVKVYSNSTEPYIEAFEVIFE